MLSHLYWQARREQSEEVPVVARTCFEVLDSDFSCGPTKTSIPPRRRIGRGIRVTETPPRRYVAPEMTRTVTRAVEWTIALATRFNALAAAKILGGWASELPFSSETIEARFELFLQVGRNFSGLRCTFEAYLTHWRHRVWCGRGTVFKLAAASASFMLCILWSILWNRSFCCFTLKENRVESSPSKTTRVVPRDRFLTQHKWCVRKRSRQWARTSWNLSGISLSKDIVGFSCNFKTARFLS